jgi:hypothetical protein
VQLLQRALPVKDRRERRGGVRHEEVGESVLVPLLAKAKAKREWNLTKFVGVRVEESEEGKS